MYFAGSGADQVKAAVKAKEIMAAQGREVAVAIDLGPLGELRAYGNAVF